MGQPVGTLTAALSPDVPIGEQLKAQIRVQILNGRLRPQDRLPPVRTLAGYLRVNRNTVARVYRELEAEGLLDTAAGRGTFVARRDERDPAVLRPLLTLADHLLAAGRAAGLSVEDLRGLLSAHVAAAPTATPEVVFVECNEADIAYFHRAIEAAVGVPVRAVLLNGARRAARTADILCTTFFHVEAVQAMFPKREVIGLVAVPDFATLQRVAEQPRDRILAIVCATEEGARGKELSIRSIGVRGVRLRTAHLADLSAVRAALSGADAVVASPRVLDRIPGAWLADVERIAFGATLVDGAVALLRQRIDAWRWARERGAMASATAGS
ncbi:MAG: GntR family transcriptional regulator [Armatimonadetes bacterium]|nr:GntR family transcriptional regulator [Armatimonadota bacterium]